MAVKRTMDAPNLPFYFNKLGGFLRDVNVPLRQQKELDEAKKALGAILQIVYGYEPSQICWGNIPRFPPI